MKKISEDKHKELLEHLKPLIKFMDDNGYTYLFVAGKDGKCARHLNGSTHDLTSILYGMADKYKRVKQLFDNITK